MLKRQLKTFIMTIIVMAFLALIGTTYAYYQVRIIENKNTKSIDVTSKYLAVEYVDGASLFAGDSDHYMFPGDTFTKTFSVSNTGNDLVQYNIKLRDVFNEFSRQQDLIYELKIGNVIIANGQFPGSDAVIYERATIESGQTKTYTLVVTYKETEDSQNVDIDKLIEATIDIEASLTRFDTADEDTLLYAIGKNSNFSNPLTTPGREVSASDEAVLATAVDDDGFTYYYRGNVTNNYVNYSGMCWRIVRVQGNGGIKLVLADRDNECDNANYSTSNTGSGYIADPTQQHYALTTLKFDGSDLQDVLNTWVTGGSYSYYYPDSDNIAYIDMTGEFTKGLNTSKLMDIEWCNDTTIMDEYTNPAGSQTLYGGAYARLQSVATATPTLKCNMVGMDGVPAAKFTSNIGLLTADEIAYAGSITRNEGSSYLITNASYNYWTLSIKYGLDSGTAYYTGNNLSAIYIYFSYPDGGSPLRPAIVLQSDVKVYTDSDVNPGTYSNPYKVVMD